MDTFDLNTFIVMIISFLVFMVLMKNVFFDPIREIKQERELATSGQLAESEALLTEHQALFASYEEELKKARLQAQKIITEFRDKAKQDAYAKVNATREDSRVTLEKQLADIAEEREAVYGQLESEKKTLVSLILDKVFKAPSISLTGVGSADA
jgi:F-type H+-transporting ATPase subunit b